MTRRVLHILHSMNRGGAEAMLMNYYRNIDRRLLQFDFLLTEPKRCLYEDEIEALGGKVYRVPLLSMTNPLPYINGVKQFLLSHSEYGIVHSHTSSKSAVPLWVAKQCGVPVRISHSHNNKSEGGLSGFVRDFLKIPLKKVATDFFACGEDAARWLYGDSVVGKQEVKIIKNAIDIEPYTYDEGVRNDVRGQLSVDDDTVVVGLVARFSEQKNHAFALDVIRALKDRGKKIKLLLVGDGELRAEITRKTSLLGIEDEVIMVGVVDNVYRYLQGMDMAILPSFNEGLGIVLIEAQANGLSCMVSTAVPREADVTGNVTFLPLEVDAWVRSIEAHVAGGCVRDDQAVEKVRQAGYDIREASKWLEGWYLKKM